ncbi:MAG: TsaC protein (YrdC domain) required for threonylcarbamoyladenosine t(6)A37 modification in tRNA [uncultured Sulfurovum sp.]|uniref:TsaC protein (YrdC domain) required for threonylcarbamoyladenosine t(6)A37 modification in tRNA n=1 Tax=uncultured Sulfurovum sp. TaxID=269237 RepID=A0A6S6T4V4_9BACT|nr:MAG: TsaC protein (YrdC domain) required for threonylcarbamoyladenosine t(6)A37 modification in tRNA [uncultured Sulfurovum sp.]
MQINLFLTQTDTTIGFVSQESTKIDRAKKRKPNKHYIQVVNSLKTLKQFSRVPNKYKNQVRRAKRTTFIMPNGMSFRVVKDTEHNLLLDRLKWVYSSSANLSGAEYDETYARDNAEVILSFPKQRNGKASTIYKLSQTNIRSIR